MRIIKILFLILLLLFSALYAARFILLERIASYALGKAGAETISLHISDIGLHQIHVADLTATFKSGPDRRLPVQLQDISIHYNLPQLLTTAQCTKIIVNTMKIWIDDSSKKPQSPLHLPEHINLLSSDLRAHLPVQNIHIAQLLLLVELSPQLNKMPLEIKADVKDGAVSAAITMQVKSDTVISMELHSPDPDHGTLRILGRQQENSLFRADLKLQPEQLTGTVTLQAGSVGDILRQIMNLSQLPELSAELEGNFSIPLPGSRNTSFSINTRAENLIFSNLQASSVLLQATGKLQGNSIHLAKQSRLELSSLDTGGITVHTLAVDLAGTFLHAANGFTCTLDQKNKLHLDELTTDALHIAELTLQAHNPLQFTIANNGWSLTGNTLDISPLRISEGTRRYETGSLLCRISTLERYQTGFSLSSAIRTPSLLIFSSQKRLSVKQLSGILQLRDNRLSARLTVSPAEIDGSLRGKLSHDFSTDNGSFSLHTENTLDLNREGVALSNLFTPWQLPFDLNKGTLSGKAAGKWVRKKKPQLTVSFTIHKGSGFYKHFLFNGLDSDQDLAVLPFLQSQRPGKISLEHLIGGFDLHTIATDIEFLPSQHGTLPKVRINDFKANLFDGSLNSPAILYDFNAPKSNFTINITNINLAPLIGLLQQNDLEVSGRLSGTLPIQITNQNISVNNGKLHNEPPGGEIHYTLKNMNQQGIAGYALKAVENFHYDSLRATAMYAPSGELDLDIHLQGISPALDEKRPVHLNIHAQQNLPDLLESLRFSKGLIEKLDKRIQRQYK